ncbi:MAG: prepilin-type N-terminal cleavage/methylation domain-containing protein [Akkermansiaceae bacterium]
MKKISIYEKEKTFRQGLTLIEMTVVILVILLLVGVSVPSVSAYRQWSIGTQASQSLREIYTAQRTYLAENPTKDVTTIVEGDIIPYLSNGATSLPIIKDVDGTALVVNLAISPPVIIGTDGNDPSGSDTDGLWDLGE